MNKTKAITVSRINNHSIRLRSVFAGIIIGIILSVAIEYLTETTPFGLLHQKNLYARNDSKSLTATGREITKPEKPNYSNLTSQTVNWNDILSPGTAKPETIHAGESELADVVKDNIRILCWIMTQPNRHKERALAARATWGKRCTVLFFVSTQTVNSSLDDGTNVDTLAPPETVVYNGNESREILWGKTKLGFQHAYDNYFDKVDWFVKADDDTFLVMENLRLLLIDKDPAYPIYYGCKFKVIVKPNGYMSGGAGYVLSKEALKRFVEISLPNKTLCRQEDNGAEDAEIGKCLQNVGVEAGDSRDSEGFLRFFPFTPESHVVPHGIEPNLWYWKNIWYSHEQGVECCSDSVIGFHYLNHDQMWSMEYLIYHLHPFGINPKLTGSEVKDKIKLYLHQKPHYWSWILPTCVVPSKHTNDCVIRSSNKNE
ncbi:hypothetical protein CHUAL_007546 [Chamberlinius hualienensis]